MSTADRLADALVEAGAPPVMVRRAREGYYDDYRSPLPFPLSQLVTHARAHGLQGIAQRAMDGEFDGTSEEADAWAKSPEGREAFKEFGL